MTIEESNLLNLIVKCELNICELFSRPGSSVGTLPASFHKIKDFGKHPVGHEDIKLQILTISNSATNNIRGLVVQLVRMPACHAGGRRFESVPGRH